MSHAVVGTMSHFSLKSRGRRNFLSFGVSLLALLTRRSSAATSDADWHQVRRELLAHLTRQHSPASMQSLITASSAVIGGHTAIRHLYGVHSRATVLAISRPARMRQISRAHAIDLQENRIIVVDCWLYSLSEVAAARLLADR